MLIETKISKKGGIVLLHLDDGSIRAIRCKDELAAIQLTCDLMLAFERVGHWVTVRKKKS